MKNSTFVLKKNDVLLGGQMEISGPVQKKKKERLK